jgi:hypothetical protein
MEGRGQGEWSWMNLAPSSLPTPTSTCSPQTATYLSTVPCIRPLVQDLLKQCSADLGSNCLGSLGNWAFARDWVLGFQCTDGISGQQKQENRGGR